MIYALLDKSKVIEEAHLRAALAVWHYCEGTVRYVFGTSTGDANADKILKALRDNPEGMSKADISSKVFKRNADKTVIDAALDILETAGLAKKEYRQSDDEKAKKTVEWWIAC
jgi:predicted transcriptional regulator